MSETLSLDIEAVNEINGKIVDIIESIKVSTQRFYNLVSAESQKLEGKFAPLADLSNSLQKEVANIGEVTEAQSEITMILNRYIEKLSEANTSEFRVD